VILERARADLLRDLWRGHRFDFMRMEPANEIGGERDSMGGVILPDHQAHRPYGMLRRHALWDYHALLTRATRRR
jgi:hypothetical protein